MNVFISVPILFFLFVLGFLLTLYILNRLKQPIISELQKLNEKKSYLAEMAIYDKLEVKPIDHLPTKISLEELMQSDGEIPNSYIDSQE